MASLKSIFDQFDLNQSGYIDCGELKEVTRRLGEQLSDQTLKEIMSGIDSNKDSKISYEEFKEWWVKGHKGKLNDFILLKSKGLKAINAVKEKLNQKDLLLQDQKVNDEKDTGKISIMFGDNRNDKNSSSSGIRLGFLYGANEYKKFKEQSEIKNIFLDEQRLSVTLKFETDQPKELQKSLRKIIEQVLSTFALSMGLKFEYEKLEKNDYLQIKMDSNQKQNYLLLYIEPGNMANELLDQIIAAQQALTTQFGKNFQAKMEVQLSVFTSLKDMLRSNKNLAQGIIQGCSLNLSGSMTSSAAKILKKFLFENSRETDAILITLTRNFNLDFKIRTPEKLEEFFKKLGIWQTVSELPSFKDLLDIIIPELQAMKDKSSTGQRVQIPFFNEILKFVKVLATYCNPGVSFVLQKKNLALFGFIDGEGLKDLYDIVFPK